MPEATGLQIHASMVSRLSISREGGKWGRASNIIAQASEEREQRNPRRRAFISAIGMLLMLGKRFRR